MCASQQSFDGGVLESASGFVCLDEDAGLSVVMLLRCELESKRTRTEQLTAKDVSVPAPGTAGHMVTGPSRGKLFFATL